MAAFCVVIAEPPYGSERVYSALRFVLTALVEGHKVNLFLLEEGIFTSKRGQKPLETPGLLGEHESMPNCGDMLTLAIRQGAVVRVCGVCASTRGLKQDELIEGAQIGSMHDLVTWVAQGDKTIFF